MNLKELADKLEAELSGPEDLDIVGVAGIREAGAGYLSFVDGKNHLKDLEASHASAVLAPADTPEVGLPLLRVKNPRLAFARALALFYGKPYRSSGISDRAAVGRNVRIGTEPSIHPFVVVDDDARIGDRVTLYPGVYVGKGSIIGDDCRIHPNVSIGENIRIGKRVIIHAGTVIGSDGFGFVTDGGQHHKIPQVGGVIIEEDVEIGGNCTIDRATLGNTLIRRGTKLDNQVHIAHNVTIGEHCLLAGQSGVAGSSRLGNYVVLGGKVGVGDHVTVGDKVMAGGGSAITRDVDAGQIIVGYNAMPIRDWLKVQAILPKLPELKKAVGRLESQVEDLKKYKKPL
jgi:UDP-3-O-[3-hydroxymyristoyl] glucosamine N-acyltransferase